MVKIYLFRHGETDFNKQHRIQCSVDTELNETGLKQAEMNVELLKDKKIEYIYSSPLKRAYKTAEVLAKKINVKVEIVNELIEMKGGKLEGHFKEEIKKALGDNGRNYEIFSHTRNDGMEISYPDGETKRNVRSRITKAVLEICKKTPYNIIGVSSHGFVLRELIRATDFEDDSGIENCEIIEAEYSDNKFKIIKRFKAT
jgi:broad specificity phosphatase PhoE